MKASSFFTKKPTGLMRFKIDLVLRELYSGLDRSIFTNKGIEFKRLRPYNPIVDTPTAVDDMASHRLSDEPELEPYSRVHYAPKRISVVVLLNISGSMGIPAVKEEQASLLFWFMALSAFKHYDYFRVITYDLKPLGDSGVVVSEDELVDFFSSHNDIAMPSKSFLRFDSVYSYLSQCDLHDTVLFVISDFAHDWNKELSFLRGALTRERNIKLVLCALDEWEDFSPSPYAMVIYDPRLGKYREYCPEELKELKSKALAHFLSIEESVRPLGALFIKVSILADPLAVLKQALLRIGFK